MLYFLLLLILSFPYVIVNISHDEYATSQLYCSCTFKSKKECIVTVMSLLPVLVGEACHEVQVNLLPNAPLCNIVPYVLCGPVNGTKLILSYIAKLCNESRSIFIGLFLRLQ